MQENKHEENFKPGDIITGDLLCGHNVMVTEQIHNVVMFEYIYGKGNKGSIDCVNYDVYKVFVGDF